MDKGHRYAVILVNGEVKVCEIWFVKTMFDKDKGFTL